MRACVLKRGLRWVADAKFAWALSICCVAALFGGCDRDKPSAPQVDPPSVYMKDPEFRSALAEKREERQAILHTREALVVELEKFVNDARAKTPNADDAALKEELMKNPEYVSLLTRFKDANEAFEDNRKATTAVVRDRISPKKNNLK